MVAYSLVRFGHKDVYVLDGGIDIWKAEKRPFPRNSPKSKNRLSKRGARDFFIDYAEFRLFGKKRKTFVIDARPTRDLSGAGAWIRPGHIPGAVNLPWRSLMTDENPALLKPKNAHP
jgi:thiosulfate/3-mercaptopyruvate sulfurtransferase